MAIKTTTVSVQGTIDSEQSENGLYSTPDITKQFNAGKIINVTANGSMSKVVGFTGNSFTVKLYSALSQHSQTLQLNAGVSCRANKESANEEILSLPYTIAPTFSIKAVFQSTNSSGEVILEEERPYKILYHEPNYLDIVDDTLCLFFYFNADGAGRLMCIYRDTKGYSGMVYAVGAYTVSVPVVTDGDFLITYNDLAGRKNKVKSCIFTLWNKKQIDFTSALVIPIVYNPVLDETLDTAKIILSDLRKKDYHDIDVTSAFEPNTLVTITFEEQETTIKMLIAHDDCRMQRKDGTPWRSYKHEIQLVELTKELERLSVDTLTFTNPLPRVYDSEAYAVWDIMQVK